MKRYQGITLLELMIAIAISLIIFAAFSMWFILALRAEDYSNNLIRASEQARRGMSTVTRELREAIAGEDGSYALEVVTPNELVFYSDMDADGQAERLRYSLENGVLVRGMVRAQGFPAIYPLDQEEVKDVATDLLNDADQPVFSYYGQGYRADIDPLIDPVVASDVRLVHLNLIVDPNPSDARDPYVVETDVQLRNIIESE